MRIVRANNKKVVRMSRKEWENIGKKAGWKMATNMPEWIGSQPEQMQYNADQYLKILQNVGEGQLTQSPHIFNSKIELTDDTMGTSYVEVYLDKSSSSPRVIIDRYFEDEMMDDQLGKKYAVAIDLDDVEGSAAKIKKAIDKIKQ